MIRACGLATLLLIAKLAAAQPAPTAPPPAPEHGYTTPQVEVVGRAPRALDHVPGSATLLKQEDLRHLAPQSGADALRTVTGLNVVGEDPIGLRLNTSMWSIR